MLFRHHIFLILPLFLLSCLNERPTRFDHTTPEPPREYEDPYKGEDRHIWQKPDFVISKIGALRNKTVADIGAGSGFFAFRFLRNNARVIGIDIDPEMIKIMNAEKSFYPDSLQGKFETRLAKPDDPLLKDEEVDYVFLSNTYPYIENRIQYFSALKNKLKTGGRIMIVDFKKKSTPIGPPLSDRIPMGDVETELTAAGYRILTSDDQSLDFQYIIIAEKESS